MSNKKQLLTESEVRRFMALANIPTIGNGLVKESGLPMAQEPHARQEYGSLARNEEAVHEEEMLDTSGLGDEEGAEHGGEETAGMEGGVSEEQGIEVLKAVAKALGIEADFSAEESAEEEGEEEEEGGEEESAEEEGGEEEDSEEETEEDEGKAPMMEAEAEEEEEEEETEGEMKKGKQLDESVVNAVLARVTSRLIEEAKKAKTKKAKVSAADKKKAEMKKKAAEMKKKKEAEAAKKKKLEEANAPAPKSTMSNAGKAGVAKAAGKADKGTWGVSSKVQADMKWGSDKGGHEMGAAGDSSEHIISHGTKSLVTKGKK